MIFEPCWAASAPGSDATDPADFIDAPPRADVVIVGGGYTGLSAARTLARSGATVVLFEAGDVGSGASSRNAGQVLTGLRVGPATLVRRYGERRARELFEASREAIAGLARLVEDERIDCELAQTGHLQAAWKPAHFGAFKAEQSLLSRVFNHRVELITPDSQDREIGSRRYHGLMLDEASFAVHPLKLVRALVSSARGAGATLIARNPVTRLERNEGGWRVSTDRASVETARVLVATNGYTTALTPALQRRVVPVGSYIIATAPLPADVAARVLPRGRMVFDTKHFLYYFRLTSDRRLLFGGRAQFSAVTEEGTRRAAAVLHRAMLDVFPYLSSTAVEFAWSGRVAFARDELPHAGQLDGLDFAAGYAGHGIAMAIGLGEVVARRMAGHMVRHPFLDTPFNPIPLYSGSPWFLPIVGAVYRVLDRIA